MKKRWITVLGVVLLAIASTISATVILAGGEDGEPSGVDKLSAKVAAILGLDETIVDDAIQQARRELWEEGLQAKVAAFEEKLTAMVEKGLLTQEQADEKLAAFQSKSNYDSGLKKKTASKEEALQAKVAVFEEKLTAMVEKGLLTQEQADEKLKSFQAKKTEKVESS